VELFESAGLNGVEVMAIDIPMPFAGFEDYIFREPGARARLCYVAR